MSNKKLIINYIKMNLTIKNLPLIKNLRIKKLTLLMALNKNNQFVCIVTSHIPLHK